MPFGIKKTRMAWQPDGEEILMICLFVVTQLTNVIDRQTDRQTHRHRMTAKAVPIGMLKLTTTNTKHRAASLRQLSYLFVKNCKTSLLYFRAHRVHGPSLNASQCFSQCQAAWTSVRSCYDNTTGARGPQAVLSSARLAAVS